MPKMYQDGEGKWVKICTKCKEVKEVHEYRKDQGTKDGLGTRCKVCLKVPPKPGALRSRRPPDCNGHRECIKCHEIKPLEAFYLYEKKQWREHQCLECKHKDGSEYARAHKEKTKARESTPEKKARRNEQRYRRYREDATYREHILARSRENRKKPERRKKAYQDAIRRYRENPKVRVVHNLRTRLVKALRYVGVKKTCPSLDLLGCSRTELVIHLESKWQSGMSWENYGYGKEKWVMDHIIPCAAFDLMDIEQQRKCFHWTNLQPLWWADNLKKRASLPEGYTPDGKPYREG